MVQFHQSGDYDSHGFSRGDIIALVNVQRTDIFNGKFFVVGNTNRTSLALNGFDCNGTEGEGGFAVLVSDVSTSLSFEGTTVNDHQTSFKFVDPSHDNLITFPDVTGTVITSGNIVDLTESMRDLKIISMEVSGESNLLGPVSLNGDFKVGDSTFTIDKASGNTIVKGTATVEDRSKLVGNVTLGDHADILTAGSERKVMLKQNAMHAWSFVDGGVAFESVAYDDGNGVVATVGTHLFETNDVVLISDVQVQQN